MNLRTKIRYSNTPWVAIAAGWTVYGIVMATQSYFARLQAGQPIDWVTLLLAEVLVAWIFLIFTPVILLMAKRFPIQKGNLVWTLPLHLLVSAAIGGIESFLIVIVRNFVLLFPAYALSFHRPLVGALSSFDYGMLAYGVVLLLEYSSSYYRRLQEQEVRASHLNAQLAQASLHALRMQFHPHFLFNTLNAISGFVRSNPEGAVRMIVKLSHLLRKTLETEDIQLVRLDEELDYLKAYLDIERTRFGKRLRVKFSIDEDTKQLFVPVFILQPLVENAIVHGIAKATKQGRIEISAHSRNRILELSVRDSGNGHQGKNKEIKDGVGLSNVRSRLLRLYGNSGSLRFEGSAGIGFEVTIQIPRASDSTVSEPA